MRAGITTWQEAAMQFHKHDCGSVNTGRPIDVTHLPGQHRNAAMRLSKGMKPLFGVTCARTCCMVAGVLQKLVAQKRSDGHWLWRQTQVVPPSD